MWVKECPWEGFLQGGREGVLQVRTVYREQVFAPGATHRLLASTSVAGYSATRRQHASAECHAPIFSAALFLRPRPPPAQGCPRTRLTNAADANLCLDRNTESSLELKSWQPNSAESNRHILKTCESNLLRRKLEGWRRSMHGSFTSSHLSQIAKYLAFEKRALKYSSEALTLHCTVHHVAFFYSLFNEDTWRQSPSLQIFV